MRSVPTFPRSGGVMLRYHKPMCWDGDHVGASQEGPLHKMQVQGENCIDKPKL
jgi:hypothetical protein